MNSAPVTSAPVPTIKHSRPATFDPILFAVFLILLCAPLAFGAVQPWARFTLEASAAALFIAWVIRQVRNGEIRVSSNPLFIPIIAFGVFSVLQLLLRLTSYRYESQSHLLLFAAYAIFLFLVVQLLQRTRQVKLLAAIFTGYGAALAMFALVQGLTSNNKLYWIRAPQNGGAIYGPYVNHNHYAGLIEMLLPIALVTSLSHYTRTTHKIVASFCATLMAVTVFLSGSRGGMLAFTIQMFVLAAVLLRYKRDRKLILGFGIFAALLIAIFVWLADSTVTARIASIHDETHSELSGGTRLTIDHDGLRMFATRPVLGWGLGTFPDVYPQFRSFYTDFRINAAHNDFLQLLIEMGSVGFAIMLWCLIIVYRNALRKLDQWPSNINGAVALAAVLGITGILVHGLVDFNLQIPANAALFWVLCALAAMEPRFGVSAGREIS